MIFNLQVGVILLGLENLDDYFVGYCLYFYFIIECLVLLINVIDFNNSKLGIFCNICIIGFGVIDGNGWLCVKIVEIIDELG